jgi:hypothetical protein
VPQSGKSKIALSIYSRWSRFIGADPKAEPDLVPPNTKIVRSGAEAAAALPGRVMWWPPIADVRKQRADFDVAVGRVLAVRRAGGASCGIVVHEGHALVDPGNCGPALNVALLQGPAMQIPMVYCFQEAVRIWVPFLTAASIVIVTFLEHDQLVYLSRRLSAPELLASRDGRPPDFSFVVLRRADPSRGIRQSIVECPPLA